jgi:subtilase family serine protease
MTKSSTCNGPEVSIKALPSSGLHSIIYDSKSDPRSNGSIGATPMAAGTIKYQIFAQCVGTAVTTGSESPVITVNANNKFWSLTTAEPETTPPSPMQGEAFSAQIQVTNSGNQASPQFTVQLTVDGANEGEPQTLPSLQPGKSATLSFPVQALSGDSHSFDWLVVELNNSDLTFATVEVD